MLLPITWQSHLSWILLFFMCALVRAQEVPQCNQSPESMPTNYTDFSAIVMDQRIYLTGGNMDGSNIWTLDLSQGLNMRCPAWEVRETSTDIAIGPYSYGIAFASSEQLIYVQAGDGGTVDMDNMVVYNTSSSTWSKASVNTTSPLPESRAQMSATMDTTSGRAWFYGGRAIEAKEEMGERAYYNDFYSYNTLTAIWDWPIVRYAWGQRPARFGHTSNLVGNQLFIIGGKTAVVNASGDTWVINPADFQSVLVYDTDELKSVTMATIGDVPNGKVGFSSSLAPDGHSIVIFGGEDATTGENTQDVYLLDTCTLTWSERDISGMPPSARSGHQAVSFDDYMLVLMGFKDHDDTEYAEDIGILDMSIWQWVDDLPQIEQPKGPQKPDCRFTFPHMPDINGNNGGDSGLPYDPTVISNPNQSGDNRTQVALGATFGVIGFILCVGAAVLFIRRLRKNAHTPNPRWLPGALKKEAPPPRETDTAAKSTIISMDSRSPERPPAALPNPIERI